jgi:hypothetical protein
MKLFFILSLSPLLNALDLAILSSSIQESTAVSDLLTDFSLVAIALDRHEEVQEANDMLALVAHSIALGVVALQPFHPAFDLSMIQQQVKARFKL